MTKVNTPKNIIFLVMLIFLSLKSFTLAKKAAQLPPVQETVPESIDNSISSTTTAGVVSEENCFLGTYEELIANLNQKIKFYSSRIDIADKTDLKAYLTEAELIGKVDGHKDAGTVTEEDFKLLNASREQFAFYPEFKSEADLDYETLITQLKDHLRTYGTERNYPCFLIDDLSRLIHYSSLRERINTSNQNLKLCVAVTENNLKFVSQLEDDPVNPALRETCEAYTVDDFTIDPRDFDESGVAMAYWYKVNTYSASSTGTPIAQGFVNNNRQFTLSFNKGEDIDQLINTIELSEETITLPSTTICNEYVFVMFSAERDSDHFKVSFAMRMPSSNTRHFFQRKETADVIENLKINLFRPTVTNGPFIYKRFAYSRSEEDRVLFDSARDLDKALADKYAICHKIPNCLYTFDEACKKCAEGFFVSEGVCVEKCPNGTYPNEDHICNKCPDTCSNCVSATQCIECKEKFLLVKTDSGAKCDTSCPVSMTPDSDNKVCVPCPNNCYTCLNEKDCKECNPGFALYKSQCESTCPEGTFKTLSAPIECKSCLEGCQKCSTLEKCDKCSQGYYLNKDGVCVKNCGNGFFNEDTTQTCQPCVDNCVVCKDKTKCETCKEGFPIDQETQLCKSKCDNGQVLFRGVCIWCQDRLNCLECDPNNVQLCSKCTDKKFLKNGQCVDNCGEGYYVDEQNHCAKCVTDCKTCTKDKCINCVDGHYLLEDKSCPTNCPDGYIVSGQTCIKCKEPTLCKKCLEKDLGICTDCYLPKVLKEGECVSDCGDYYYLQDSKCNKCSEGCLKCKNGIACDTCDKGFYLKGTECVKDCGEGMVPVDGVCQKCTVEDCSKCSEKDKTLCQQCKDPKVLYGNKCYTSCPVGTFQKPDRTCENCGKDCNTCTNSTTCKECKKPKVLQGDTCKDACDDGYSPVESICKPCTNTTCKKCDGTSLDSCTECNQDNFLFNKNCVPECPAETFKDGLKCTNCVKPCKTCKSAESTGCLDCIEGFALTPKGECTDNCPDGTALSPDGKTCQTCLDDGCVKCDPKDVTECLKCPDPRVVLKGDCFDKCPDGFFNSNGTCQPCLTGCKKCEKSEVCQECQDGLFLKNGNTCLTDCGEGWIKVNKECVQCKGNCSECKSTDLNYCTKCPKGLLLLEGKCLNECPDKFWSDNTQCNPCEVKECTKCSSQGKVCEKCSNDLVLNDNQCIPRPCPDGKVEITGKCHKCEVSDCKVCPADNTKVCKECVKPNFLVNEFKCSPTCDIETYGNKETGKCESCISNCNTCTNAKTCEVCKFGFYLQEGVCVNNCKEGFRIDGQKCVPCSVENCSKCTDTSCVACKSPLVLNGNTCDTSCPEGFFIETVNAFNAPTCKECSPYCLKCENAQVCITCDESMALSDEKKCIDHCPDRSVEINNECVHCKTETNCLKCDSSDVTTCIQCADNLVLTSNNRCQDKCDDGYFADNGVCKKCVPNCKLCTNDKTCEVCNKDFYLDTNNHCVTDCPKNFYKGDGKCVRCNDPNCDNCTSEKCQKCAQGLYLENGVCKKECSPGYFLFNFVECQKCGEKCITCENADKCKVCEQNYFLLNGKCVQNCGDGFVAVGSECKPCDTGCKTCSSNNPSSCLVCNDPKFLHLEKCVDTCPAKYFPNKDTKACEKCTDNCDICDAEDCCSKCESGYSYQENKNKCVKECDDGYSPRESICKPCEVADCKKCNTSLNTCDECSNDTFKLDSKCVPSCPAMGYYIDLPSNECKKCPTECTTCKSPSECKTCEKGFLLRNGKCVNQCEGNEVDVEGECKPCIAEDCAKCVPQKPDTCDKCNQVKLMVDVSGVLTPECRERCPDGYISIEGDCVKCELNCASCSSPDTCEFCDRGYLLQNGDCVNQCSLGKVERSGKCVPCNDNKCLVCDNLTLETCSKCDQPFKLKSGKCYNECENEFFEVKIGDYSECKNCIEKCAGCNNEQTCTTCIKGSYLKDSKCVDNCGEGYVVVNEKECKKCTQDECRVCSPSNLDTCTECKTPYFMTPKANCVSSCGDKFFSRQSPTPACIPCIDANCLTCAPENMCSKCASPFLVSNNACATECPDKTYDKNGVCTSCEEKSCKKCYSDKPAECKECNKGEYLHEKKCVSSCPDGTFPNIKGECQQCSGNCQKCLNESVCQICKTPFYLDEKNSCTDKCKDGYVEVGVRCEKCTDANCVKCDSKDVSTCTQCEPTKFLFNGDCVDTCPKGTFISGRNCLKCEDNCDTCSDAQTCTKCTSPYLEQSADCVKECKIGSTNVDGHCTECKDKDKCDACKSDLTTCTKCRTPLLLAAGKCIEKCESGKFYDEEGLECFNCKEHCIDCEDDCGCKKCEANYFLLNEESCVNDCGDKKYADIPSQTCKPCANSNCQKCDATSPQICTECPLNTFLFQKNEKEADCVSPCPEGTYQKDNKCIKCDPTCKVCKDANTCQSCNSPYTLMGTSCISDCPVGYTNRNEVCIKCADDNCANCDASNLSKCIKCSTGILFRESCIASCPEKYYYSKSANTCLPCSTNCQKCDENGCITCENNFYFMDGSTDKNCISCIKPNLVKDGKCTTCKVTGCIECLEAQDDKCRVCKDRLILFHDKCIDKCPEQHYFNGQTCEKCEENCDKCNNKDECTKCKEKYVLLNGKCEDSCPDGFAQVLDICSPCADKNCERCGESVKDCEKCKNKTVVLEGKCVDNCPDGYFLKGEKCEKCPNFCKNCDDKGCKECLAPRKLKSNECVTDCGEGFYDNNKTCESCTDSSCKKCSPAIACQECFENSYLLLADKTCKTICPEGLFADKNTKQCEPCPTGCSKCTAETCIECSAGFFMNQGQCIKSCPEKTTNVNGICVKCIQPECQQCVPEHPDQCHTCSADTFRYEATCIEDCTPGTYKSGNECKDCDSKCKLCTAENSCTECKFQFFLVEGKCENDCPDGKVKSNGQCINCSDEKCKACSSDGNTCLQCNSPSVVLEGKCISDCPSGYFANDKNECIRCNIQCATCRDNQSCETCRSGFFKKGTDCVATCEKGFFGDCSEGVCKPCDSACEDCVGPTSTDCVNCAQNFFRDTLNCVSAESCRKGTFANSASHECSVCRVSFCESCTDAASCSQCVTGMALKDNKCVIGRSFKNIISGVQLISNATYEKVVSPLANFNGIAVGAPHVTLSFWVRLNAPLQGEGDGLIFSIDNYPGYDWSMIIDSKSQDCKLITTFKDTPIASLTVGSCTYTQLYNWNFFAVSINKDGKDFTVSVSTLDEGKLSTAKGTVSNQNNIGDILTTNAKFVFGFDVTPVTLQQPTIEEMFNLNVYDYTLSESDVINVSKTTPTTCDFFCTQCGNTCSSCVDGPVNTDGYCKANGVSISDGVILLPNLPNVLALKNQIVKSIVSDRWAIHTWFFVERADLAAKEVNLVSVDYSLPTNSLNVLSLSFKGDKLNLDGNDFDFTLKTNTWYFLTVHVIRKTVAFSITDLDKNVVKNQIQYTNDFERLFDDYSVTIGDVNWSGSVSNPFFYINNIPDEETVNRSLSSFKCPDNCSQCTKDKTCAKCIAGFKVGTDGSCVEDSFNQVETLLQRVDLWNNENFELPLPSSLPDIYSVSFWLRKKTHSKVPTKPTHNLFSLKTKDSSIIPVVTQTLNVQYESKFSFLANGVEVTSLSMSYADGIYDYISVVLVFNKKDKTLSFNVRDVKANKEVSGSGLLSDFSSFLVGDSELPNANIEVTLVQVFRIGFGTEQINKLRTEYKPVDCSAGCKSGCNLKTGECGVCHNGKAALSCTGYLLGFSSSYLYAGSSRDYSKIVNKDAFSQGLNKEGFTVGVNSLAYSLLVHIVVFDFANMKSGERSRMLSIGNTYTDPIMGNNLIVLDTKFDGKVLNFAWTVNSSGSIKEELVTSFSIKAMNYYTVHGGIDVTNKTFNYLIQDRVTNVQYKGTVALDRNPEKLQQYSSINVFGVNDQLSAVYVLPSAKVQKAFYSPNIPYSEKILAVFVKSFAIEAEPKCDSLCSLCVGNENKETVCLKCNTGATLKGTVCEKMKTEPGYLLLHDLVVTTANFDASKAADLIAGDAYTVSFYFRASFLYTSEIPLITGGFSAILKISSEQATLAVANTSVTFNASLLYSWVLVNISKTSTGVSLTLLNEKSEIIATSTSKSTSSWLDLRNNIQLANNQFQFYGMQIISEAAKSNMLTFPKVDCPRSCTACINNSCVSCLYGMEQDGTCRTVSHYPDLLNYKGENIKISDIYTPILMNYMRTNKFSVEFTFTYTGTESSLLTIMNEGQKYIELVQDLSTLIYTLNFNLLGTVESIVFPNVVSPVTSMPSSEIYFGLSVKGQTVNAVLFNSASRSQAVTKTLTKSTGFLYEGSQIKLSNTAYDLKINEDKTFTGDELKVRAASSKAKLIQKACDTGKWKSCSKCNTGVINKAGICTVAASSSVTYLNQIISYSRWMTHNTVIKYNFIGTTFSSFSYSFWWKLEGSVNKNQGVLQLNLAEGTKMDNLLSLIFSVKNSFELSLNWNGTKSSTSFPAIYKNDNVFTWAHVSLRFNSATGKLNVDIVNEDGSKSAEREITVSAKALAGIAVSKKVMYARFAYTDTKSSVDENVSFSVSNVIFEENTFVSATQLASLRTNPPELTPLMCNGKILAGTCLAADKVTSTLNIGDIFLGSDLTALTNISSEAANLLLFRPIHADFDIPSQTFQNFLISFTLDVNAFLSSKYAVNNDVLFLISNDNKSDYDSMTMADLIPSTVTQTSALSLVNSKGKLVLYKGYTPWASAVDSFELPLGGRLIKDFTYITIVIQVHKKTSTRIFVMADDISFTIDLKQIIVSEPISLRSIIFNHPTITNLSLNLHKPTIDGELRLFTPNFNTSYTSKLCTGADPNCKKCIVPDSSTVSYCLICNTGFGFFPSTCQPTYKSK